MTFQDGVVSIIVIRGNKTICNNSEAVYELLADNGISHVLSQNASSWTELASSGETYNEDEFDIYMQ